MAFFSQASTILLRLLNPIIEWNGILTHFFNCLFYWAEKKNSIFLHSFCENWEKNGSFCDKNDYFFLRLKNLVRPSHYILHVHYFFIVAFTIPISKIILCLFLHVCLYVSLRNLLYYTLLPLGNMEGRKSRKFMVVSRYFSLFICVIHIQYLRELCLNWDVDIRLVCVLEPRLWALLNLYKV